MGRYRCPHKIWWFKVKPFFLRYTCSSLCDGRRTNERTTLTNGGCGSNQQKRHMACCQKKCLLIYAYVINRWNFKSQILRNFKRAHPEISAITLHLKFNCWASDIIKTKHFAWGVRQSTKTIWKDQRTSCGCHDNSKKLSSNYDPTVADRVKLCTDGCGELPLLSSRQLSPNSLPRCAHWAKIFSRFTVCLPAVKICSQWLWPCCEHKRFNFWLKWEILQQSDNTVDYCKEC